MTPTKRIGPVRSGRGLAAAAGVLLLAFIVPAAAEDTAAPPAADPTVATVDGVAITENDIAIATEQFADQLARVPAAQQRQALIDVIIDIRLLARAAEKANVEKDPQVARRIAFARDRALRSEYLRGKIADLASDEAVKKKYDAEVAAFVPGDEIHVRHILVPTEDEAKAIITDLDKGGDFAKIATEKSQDPGSAPKGGDLGFIGKGRTVKPFEDAAFALEPGTYTKTPVQSEYGWHIIKVEEKRKQAPPTLDERADAIRSDLIREGFDKEIGALRAAAKIEIVPDPATAAPANPADSGAAPAAPADPAATPAPAQ
ncbi:MAG TPA: peptidylprolyl isomerase [Bauldia sp.]|nr:peptidylprolyl isomerase [Bauldia sp.]